MTAFYMTRLMALTFWGESRVSKDVKVHESPLTMTVPLIVLAALSLVGGWLGIPHLLSGGHIPNILEEWLHHSVALVEGEGTVAAEWGTMAVSVLLAGLSALTAYFLYVKRPRLLDQWREQFKKVYALIYGKYFVDEIYESAVVKPVINLGRGLWAFIDVRIVDRTTYLVSDVVKGTGNGLRLMINGNVQQYALYIVLGILTFIAFIFTR